MQENKREKSPIKSRILQYLEFKGVSEYEFYKDSGVARSTLKQNTGISEENITKFLSYARDISPLWMLTGSGDMLTTPNEEKSIILEKNKKNILPENDRPRGHVCMTAQDNKMTVQVDRPSEKTDETDKNIYFDNSIQVNQPILKPFLGSFDRPIERQQVPLYDIDASAGIIPILEGQTPPIDFISIPNLPKCDGGVNVRGNSMIPILQSGDIVLFRTINDFSNIIYGEMYLVSFHLDGDEYCVVKQILKSDNSDQIILSSSNMLHSPMEILKTNIRALAIIKATIRYNTML